MASQNNVRFVDALKVGAYNVLDESAGSDGSSGSSGTSGSSGSSGTSGTSGDSGSSGLKWIIRYIPELLV